MPPSRAGGSDEYLWPQLGHRFFEFTRTRPDAYTWMQPSFSEYGFMYRASAERLIDLACDAPGLLNVHAIPAVFLFRLRRAVAQRHDQRLSGSR